MQDAKALLEDKKASLEAELERISAPPEETGGISFGKRVGEGTSFAVERLSQVATHEQVQEVLQQVDRALAKLAEGSYGRCDLCRSAIAPARLEARPWATLCVTCAAKP